MISQQQFLDEIDKHLRSLTWVDENGRFGIPGSYQRAILANIDKLVAPVFDKAFRYDRITEGTRTVADDQRRVEED